MEANNNNNCCDKFDVCKRCIGVNEFYGGGKGGWRERENVCQRCVGVNEFYGGGKGGKGRGNRLPFICL